MFDGVQDGEYSGQGSVWTAFDLGKSCLRQIDNGKALYHNQVEQHVAAYSGWDIDTVVGHAV